MENSLFCDHLYNLGWIDGDELLSIDPDSSDDLVPYVSKYQEFHGLPKTGKLDTETKTHMVQPRFCGLPDVMQMATEEAVCAWPKKTITVKVANGLNNVSSDLFRSSVKEALNYWNEVCGINLKLVDSGVTDITITTGRIDGPQGTLAWSELPCGGVSSVTQKYDTSESWVVSERPTNGIDLVRVICHEIGHAIGIPHISSGNLMQPTYDVNIRKPKSGDIQEAVKRYGRVTNPTPPPVPDDGPVIPDPVPVPPSTESDCSKLLQSFLSTPEGKELAKNLVKALLDAIRKVS